MSDDDKIYVDPGQPATLNNGAGKLTDYGTLQEAAMAWHRLPPPANEAGNDQGAWWTSLYRSRDCASPLRAKAGVSKMAWFVHYWDKINNRNIRSSEISARENAMRKACSLVGKRWPLSHVDGPNGERVDTVPWSSTVRAYRVEVSIM